MPARRRSKRHALQGGGSLSQSTFRIYSMLLNIADDTYASFPSRLVLVGWGLVTLVTITMYTAGSESRSTSSAALSLPSLPLHASGAAGCAGGRGARLNSTQGLPQTLHPQA
jgi:hypothetical protein